MKTASGRYNEQLIQFIRKYTSAIYFWQKENGEQVDLSRRSNNEEIVSISHTDMNSHVILSEKIFLHVHGYPATYKQALGQTLDFRELVLEEILEGIQLSLIEIHLRPCGI